MCGGAHGCPWECAVYNLYHCLLRYSCPDCRAHKHACACVCVCAQEGRTQAFTPLFCRCHCTQKLGVSEGTLRGLLPCSPCPPCPSMNLWPLLVSCDHPGLPNSSYPSVSHICGFSHLHIIDKLPRLPAPSVARPYYPCPFSLCPGICYRRMPSCGFHDHSA